MNKKSKIISHAIKPFRRMGVEINETLWIDGTPYFSANGIEDWLEFKDGHKGVRRLVNRNPFIKDHSKVIEVIIDQEYHRDRGVNLTSLSLQKGTETSTKSKRQRATQIRLYSPVGLQLIAMKSNTEKARLYQVAVAKLVWKIMQGKLTERRVS
jgi:prophage antirepressor-like protein